MKQLLQHVKDEAIFSARLNDHIAVYLICAFYFRKHGQCQHDASPAIYLSTSHDVLSDY